MTGIIANSFPGAAVFPLVSMEGGTGGAEKSLR